MDLSPDFIVNVVKEIFPDMTITNAAVMYIMVLLTPYNKALAGVSSLKSLLSWVDNVFPKETLTSQVSSDSVSISPLTICGTTQSIKENDGELVSSDSVNISPLTMCVKCGMIQAIKENGGESEEYDGNLNIINAAITALFDYLVFLCVETSVGPHEFLPWDIQLNITRNGYLSTLLNVPRNINTLPLTFVLEGYPPSVFELNCEYATGFLLYTFLLNPPWHLELWGQPISIDFEENGDYYTPL